jgi:hypothetical protein
VKTSNTQKRTRTGSAPPKPAKTQPPKGSGGGYKLGPMTSNQLRARYGNRSHMWLYRNLRSNPDFPQPSFQGRMMMFSVAEFDEFDRKLLSKRSE